MNSLKTRLTDIRFYSVARIWTGKRLKIIHLKTRSLRRYTIIISDNIPAVLKICFWLRKNKRFRLIITVNRIFV